MTWVYLELGGSVVHSALHGSEFAVAGTKDNIGSSLSRHGYLQADSMHGVPAVVADQIPSLCLPLARRVHNVTCLSLSLAEVAVVVLQC